MSARQIADNGWGWGGYTWREVPATTSTVREDIKAAFRALVRERETHPQVKGKAA